MKQEIRIQTLLDKYLDGSTSAAEEQELRRYFADNGDAVPGEWAPFRALFAYVDAERRPAAAPAGVRRRGGARLRLFITSAAAAAAVVLAVLVYGHRSPESYAVIDGKVYTDRRTVTDEALDALQIVSSDCDESFDALQLMQ